MFEDVQTFLGAVFQRPGPLLGSGAGLIAGVFTAPPVSGGLQVVYAVGLGFVGGGAGTLISWGVQRIQDYCETKRRREQSEEIIQKLEQLGPHQRLRLYVYFYDPGSSRYSGPPKLAHKEFRELMDLGLVQQERALTTVRDRAYCLDETAFQYIMNSPTYFDSLDRERLAELED